MIDCSDDKALTSLVREANEFSEHSRRSFLADIGVAAIGGTLASRFIGTAKADDIKVAQGGKKIRVGIPLTYGPFNQPWRRGCWQLVQTVLDMGCEPVCIRGEPTKESEQSAERSLLDRDIAVLCMGIYSLESETAYIADEAHKRGIKTVGFGVPVKDSPAVVEDTWGTAATLGYALQDSVQRQGSIVQTAENRGFYTPFDMEADMLDLMTKYETRMKMLPFMPGGVSTQDELSISRQNVLTLLQSHPPGSVKAIASWWWPDTMGACEALRQMGRTEVKVFNHYFSNQFLSAWADKAIDVVLSTDVPWRIVGRKTAELAIGLGRGEDIPNDVYHVPVTAIRQPQAAQALAEIQNEDKQAIALLRKYGG